MPRVRHTLKFTEREARLTRRQMCPEGGRGAYDVVTDARRRVIEQAAPGHARLAKALMFDALSAQEVTRLDSLTTELLAPMSSETSANERRAT